MSSLITQLTLLISWFASVHSLRFHLPSPTAATRSVGHRLPHVTSTRLREEPPIVTHSLRVVLNARNSREDEIRRKIKQLKNEGKIKKSASSSSSKSSTSSSSSATGTTLEKIKRQRSTLQESNAVDEYADKIKAKLGEKGKLMKEGNLDGIYRGGNRDSEETQAKQNGDETDEISDNGDFENDTEEIDLIERVEEKLMEKMRKKAAAAAEQIEEGSALGPDIDDIADQMEQQIMEERKKLMSLNDDSGPMDVTVTKSTTGIGGSWAKNETAQIMDTYRPANGGWGKFPRPKDISKAYGGGKRIGADVKTTMEDEMRMQQAVEDTRDKLRRYREKVGIEVQSEKDNAQEIEEALNLGQRAMQRGIYATAVSALEKVTKYCSTNSQVGGQVFLELGMAYEAVGRTSEAIQVYSSLTNSRMEDIKFNSRRLLTGIEAIKFMRDDAKIASFSRKKSSQTFIDTTGLGNIADNFDDKYQTAYVDLSRGGNFFRKLTESVVRSIREARQILLAATGSGEVDRIKVVQALRSIDRSFVKALDAERKKKTPKKEPVAVINGVPIKQAEEEKNDAVMGMDSFNLGDAGQMIENLNGEWKLQLIADSKGDGVSYYNDTVSWQKFEAETMSFLCSGTTGFLTLTQKGVFIFDEDKRILSRTNTTNAGSGAFIKDFFGSRSLSGAAASINVEQQIISVDSELLITRRNVVKKNTLDTIKGYYTVWRRVEDGIYSSKTKQ